MLVRAIATALLVLLAFTVGTTFLGLVGLGSYFIPESEPDEATMRRQVEALDGVIPALTELGLTEWDEPCRAISYARGTFSDSQDGRCALERPRPLDDQAERDFDVVHAALQKTGVGVWSVWIHYRGGDLERAQFHLDHRRWDRWSYVLEPGASLPEGFAGELRYERIDANWYWEWEDWN